MRRSSRAGDPGVGGVAHRDGGFIGGIGHAQRGSAEQGGAGVAPAPRGVAPAAVGVGMGDEPAQGAVHGGTMRDGVEPVEGEGGHGGGEGARREAPLPKAVGRPFVEQARDEPIAQGVG